ncbi:MAG TPA: polyprenyl synthetase family protein [bacterium]|nr:polyprenyl synthetase family protein [bacterium]
MSTVAATRTPSEVLPRLEAVMAARSEDAMVRRLSELQTLLASDLADVEAALRQPRPGTTPAHASARHLLDLAGKRLRPTCVALAARVGTGFGRAARELAIAVELVHNATLLHDDVVDLGDKRRGLPTARMVYGNAASIYAGDFLLVEALERVRASGDPDLLDRAFRVLKEMLDAESLQLANRGVVRGVAGDYFRVAEGKTASLFGWALFAGARAGGCDDSIARALEGFGRKLGVAFQVVDDILDVSGKADHIGKTTFSDLREGKITHPVLLAVERDERMAVRLESACARGDIDLDPQLAADVAESIARTRALDDSRALAARMTEEAIDLLAPVPKGYAREALETIAAALPHRTK